MKFQTTIDGNILDIDLTSTKETLQVEYNKTKKRIDCVPLSPNSFSLLLSGNTHYISIIPQKNSYHVTVDYNTYSVEVKDTLEILLGNFGIFSRSPTSSLGKPFNSQILEFIEFFSLWDRFTL